MKVIKRALLLLLAMLMVGVGIAHFQNPQPFTQMVPAMLPAPEALVFISGAFEVMGGVGLLVPHTRRHAAWGLILLFVAVFPANINMAVNEITPTGADPIPVWVLWARLPFQIVFIAWAHWYTRREHTN